MIIKKRKGLMVVLIILCLILLGALVAWIWWGNSALELNSYTVQSDRLPAGFDGYRIAHISDLHNAEMGEKNEQLLSLLLQTAPDIIVITGDFVDRNRTDCSVALSFAERVMEIAPCYFVTGNHEARISDYPQFRRDLQALGVTVLENDWCELKRGDDTVTLLGLSDPRFLYDGRDEEEEEAVVQEMVSSLPVSEHYTVLLAHRPMYFDLYRNHAVDLVFSGHHHGGQFRIPFLGGLFTPREGFFPEYDGGVYTEEGVSMVVSRGIGNSSFPFRVNNRPEVILVQLERGEK